MGEAITVYISIGNSDDKLSQREWAAYVQQVNGLVQRVESIYGSDAHTPCGHRCRTANIRTPAGASRSSGKSP